MNTIFLHDVTGEYLTTIYNNMMVMQSSEIKHRHHLIDSPQI